ncbi:MAG TPA: chemotaxis response regulator protein-glutamate methylesterase [Candidatus Angelobacter sp.]
MRKIRILVVDDSVVIRRMVTDALGADPGLEVAGSAANGRIALSKIPQVNPDLVTLDIEMPEMDGLEALRELRKTYTKLPVIMFSTLTERGASATLDALALGANDYVTKPSNVGSASAALERIREELIPKIKALCRVSPAPAAALPKPAAAPKVFPKIETRGAGAPAEIIAIGVSTGGPNALAEVIPQLPASLPVPVVIVQHMPPIFTKLLAERLAAKSQIRVEEGRPGARLEPGLAWVAPGDFHMAVERKASGVQLVTHRQPPENSCRPAVDVLFRSVAEVYGSRVLGVVMTGMGQDGFRGSERIREAGGRVLAQDEATSIVWGMPGFVAQARLAEKVLPLDQIAAEIVLRVSEPRAAGSPAFRSPEAVSP